ncbi:MAG: DUF6785 family protein [Thermoprotei archaeon]
MVKKTEEKAEAYHGLTAGFLVILLVVALFTLFVSIVSRDAAGSYMYTLTGWFVPFIYIVVIMELLGRYSNRFRLNPAQYLLLLIPLWFAAGKSYITDGTSAYESPWNWLDTQVFGAFTIGGLAGPWGSNWPSYFMALPSFVIPHSISAATVLWTGLKAGQVIPWGTYAGPIVFWSLFMIATAFMNISLSFTVTGPEWTETERLVYPLMVPPIYLIQTASSRDDKGHSSLLSLKTSNMKVFWVMVVVGLIIGGVPAVLSFVPAFSYLGAYEWGEIPINWGQYIAGILPGAYVAPTFIILQAVLMILLPYEVMITSLVTWLAIPVFYDTLAVKMGWVTYVAGSENEYMVYGGEGPFPYTIWAAMGLTIGLGLYYIWRMRGRVKRVLQTITGPDYFQGDFSVRTGSIMLVGSTIFLFLLMLAMGVNWLIGIFWLAIYFIWAVAETRMMAEVWWHPPETTFGYWQLYFPIGMGLGLWSASPTPNQVSITSINIVNDVMSNYGGRLDPLGPGYTMGLYKVAHDVKASIKEVFTWTTILTILIFPISLIISMWFFAHVGMANTNRGGTAVWFSGNALWDGIVSKQWWYTGDSYAAVWGWTIGGVVLIFLLMWVRGIVPWFMFNPTAFVLTLWLPQYMWAASLFALVFKYIFSKTLGPKRTEEYIVPAATGFAVGYGALYLFAGLYVWIIQDWPWIMTVWKP